MKRLAFLLAVALLLGVAPVVGFSQTVLYFPCDDIQGDTVQDLSGAGNDGTINGQINLVPGKFGNGYEFDGASMIQVPKSGTLDITQNITVEAWTLKLEAGAEEQFVFDKRAGGPRLGYEFVQINDAFGPHFVTPPEVKALLLQDEPAPLGTWQYHAATYDGKKVKYYLDGEFLKETDQIGDLGVESDLFIGTEGFPAGSRHFYAGVVDNIRISNIARTADEIKEAYNNALGLAVNPQLKLAQTWGLIKTQ